MTAHRKDIELKEIRHKIINFIFANYRVGQLYKTDLRDAALAAGTDFRTFYREMKKIVKETGILRYTYCNVTRRYEIVRVK